MYYSEWICCDIYQLLLVCFDISVCMRCGRGKSLFWDTMYILAAKLHRKWDISLSKFHFLVNFSLRRFYYLLYRLVFDIGFTYYPYCNDKAMRFLIQCQIYYTIFTSIYDINKLAMNKWYCVKGNCMVLCNVQIILKREIYKCF